MSIRYYVTGNTAMGFVNYIDSNIQDIKRVIVLKHGSHNIKTSVIQGVITKYEADQDMEILLSSLGEKYLDGVLLKGSSIAVLADHIAPEKGKQEILDLRKIFDGKVDEQGKRPEQKHIQHATEKAYDSFAIGLSIHDKLENVYVDQMDFDRADELADTCIHRLLESKSETKKKGETYERLFGTNTPDGAVNVVPEMIQPLTNVIFIKGRAGTGKSTFMKKIANACINQGMDIEQYRCSFDPSGIDMVVVRDLDFCIFDSTDPHEFFPRSEHDYVIDLYEETVMPDTDEIFAEQIQELTSSYKSYMKQGIQYLQEADIYRDQLEEQFSIPNKEQINQFIDHTIG